MKAVFRFALSLCACAALFACNPVKHATEKEPNDTYEVAQQVTPPFVIEGTLTYAKGASTHDIDRYAITVVKETMLSVTLTPKSASDLSFLIANSKKESLKFVNDFGTNDELHARGESVSNMFLSPGTYYISVKGGSEWKKTCTYTLTLLGYPATKMMEREPNDYTGEAQEIGCNDAIRGFYAPRRNAKNRKGSVYYFYPADAEVDTYVVRNKETSVNTALNIKLTAVPSVDSAIKILNKQKRIIMRKNMNGIDAGESIEHLLFPPDETYYIVIYSVRPQWNRRIPYQVKVRQMPIREDVEYEPNNEKESAQEIAIGRTYEGRINYPGDKDLYYFELAEDRALTFIFSRVEDIELVATVNAEGEGASYPIDSRTYTKSSANFTFYAGSHYIRIEGYRYEDGKRVKAASDKTYNFEVRDMYADTTGPSPIEEPPLGEDIRGDTGEGAREGEGETETLPLDEEGGEWIEPSELPLPSGAEETNTPTPSGDNDFLEADETLLEG